MNDLPRSWASATINDTGEYINGMAFKPTDWGSKGLPIIRIQNLTDPSKELNKTTRAVDSRYLVDNGDILVSWSATLDAFIWNRGRAVLNQHIFKVVPERRLVDTGFLFHGLREKIQELSSGEHLHGSTMKHINRGPFLAHSFPVPPLAEQRRIVAKIDSLTSKSKRAREQLDHVPRLIERYKKAVLAAAFRGDLTRKFRAENSLPQQWPKSTVGAVADISSGQTPKGIEAALDGLGELPWFKVSSMNGAENLRGLRTSQFRLSKKKAMALGMRIFPPGSIAFPKRGGAIATNKKRRLLVHGALDLNLMVLTPTKITSDFLWWWIQRLDLGTISNGSNIPQINNGDVEPLEIVVPSDEEQREISRVVKSAFERIDRLATEASRGRKLIGRLEHAVLGKAFCGELVPQDPTDEPASALLERIRAQREPTESKAKRRSRKSSS
jgi:type I restriction enzyme, S subunit